MKFRTPFNYQLTGMESNELPSLTIPDQSLTVREIFERYRTGAPLDKVTIYGLDESDDDDFDSYDITRSPDFDLADADTAMLELEQRKLERKERARIIKEEKERKEKEAKFTKATNSESESSSHDVQGHASNTKSEQV